MQSRFVLLALAVCLATQAVWAEESDATESDQNPSTPVAGYAFKTDMEQHANIDKDLKEIMELTDPARTGGPDFPAGLTIYQEGKNSARSGGAFRSLQQFAADYALSSNADLAAYQAEPMAVLMQAFWGAWDWSHQSVLAAFGGSASTYGDFSSGLAGENSSRNQIIKKLIAYQIVWLYAHHEIEAARKKYTAGTYDSAVTSWDEFWAFYAGSLEDGTGSGVMPYVLAEKRATMFGTNTFTLKNGGKSMVNCHIMRATEQGQALIQTAGNEAKLDNAIQCIRAQSMVPLIQGCIWYGYRTDTTSDYETAHSSGSGTAQTAVNVQRRAELWAFCSAVLPWLKVASATAADDLKAATEYAGGNDDAAATGPSWDTIKGIFTAANLNKMGISCKDIGSLTKSDGTKAYSCTDGTVEAAVNGAISSKACDMLEQSETCKDVNGVMPGIEATETSSGARVAASALALVSAALLAMFTF